MYAEDANVKILRNIIDSNVLGQPDAIKTEYII